MFPRRGSARRPAAGVYADRYRDVLPAAGADFRNGGAAGGGGVESGRLRYPAAVPSADLRAGDALLWNRQAGLADPSVLLRGGFTSGRGIDHGRDALSGDPDSEGGSDYAQ